MSTTIREKHLKPICCRQEAYQMFVEQLPHLRSTTGLLRAAIAVSMHALDDVDPERIESRLRELSERVCKRAKSRQFTALQANLHGVLFDEEGFSGNLDHYYNALNSYLPAVINTRRGMPIIMALIYKVVGEWAGLTVAGINAPGHFMVRVRTERSWMIVDPFFGGQMLTRDEAFQRLDRVAGRVLPRYEEYLATPTHAQWLVRILGNLRALFANEGRRHDLAAMTEMARALDLATG
jgi:regulator of sirC expression with transglutaminase-like and TPR domain